MNNFPEFTSRVCPALCEKACTCGLLMYGIPNMKLEKRFIDRKIEVMKAEGVEFITGVNVGKDMKSAKLLKDNKYISAKGKNIIIIGGGDTGNDCVGTCIRHGAKSVTQLEMMPKAPDESLMGYSYLAAQ